MIHVLFCSSAAGSLRQVLRTCGRRQRVVDLTEHLDWGPINSRDFEERAGWFDRNVPCKFAGGWDWISEHVAEFGKLVADDPDRLIWIEPHAAHELSGLYWYLDRFGSAGAQMLIAPQYKSIIGLGVHGTESIADLLDNCPREPLDENRFPAERWNELRQDNSLLRIVKDEILQSAPSDYFDEFLLRRCSSNWTDWVRVVGNAMIDVGDAGHRIDDLFLQWRLRDLIRRGAAAANGDLPQYGERAVTQVRLAG